MKYLAIFILTLSQFNSLFAQEIPEIDWGALQSTKPWALTEEWEPVPPKVTPGRMGSAPSDAIVLFDGTNLEAWHKPKYSYGARMDVATAMIKARENNEFTDPGWTVKDGALIVKPGAGPIETKQAFGDCQLHIEWLSPEDPGKEGQGYSNSGIFLMTQYEIQVLNSYENKTYSNGQAGSMYKQSIPLVNASRPPGEWQAYDILFKAPQFNEDGSVKKPATITAFHNGVLIQDNFELQGPCIFIGKPHYVQHPEKMPLLLQDHGDKVRFRNIWIREL